MTSFLENTEKNNLVNMHLLKPFVSFDTLSY